ncbi:DUF4166 domain-containing protein [Asticcacaulis sp.]|uniref:DUF4166 domain-containing protein n=1 Tax=Asticcacaulis sp. TaxID=1872648 RepID=UPI002B62FA9D|nr:DUF4166 domain-containing protein [Asticcacaulis sp.]HTM81681.1 DUF4166 domain-containing protein [Asticcacaulis sp.]
MQAAHKRCHGSGDATGLLQRLLGGDWYRLHPSVRARFAHEPEQPVLYEGVMETVYCSRAGWLFAQLTRLIGNPLTARRGRDIPMQVLLTKREGGGVWWRRTYGFDRPVTVTSAKRENARGQLCEYVGMGFGMRLRVYAKDGALHFTSERYFWEIAGRQIPLPHWLSPGETHVSHTDLGGGNFRFTISMDHRQLGRTFYQTGVFREAAQ